MAAAAADGEKVQLYVYDLTQGMARTFAPMFLGTQIDAIYHTSIVIGGTEYFFGGGVHRCVAGQTPFGAPMAIEEVGVTHIPKDIREEMLADLSRQYTMTHYNFITRNCNHFANAWAELLTGHGIPDKYPQQAQQILASPIGQMLLPIMRSMEAQLGNVTAQGFQGPAAAGR